MSPYTNMPDDVKKMAMDTEADIKSGKLHLFKCPITDQDGKTVECKGGDHLDPGQILSMNWYVKGSTTRSRASDLPVAYLKTEMAGVSPGHFCFASAQGKRWCNAQQPASLPGLTRQAYRADRLRQF